MVMMGVMIMVPDKGCHNEEDVGDDDDDDYIVIEELMMMRMVMGIMMIAKVIV